MESLGISASTDVRYGLFSGGAKMDFAESNSVNSYSSCIAGRCEVHNATKHGHGFQLTPTAESVVESGDQKAFKTAFGDMFVRSLKTGGEFCVVARITSVSEAHQSSGRKPSCGLQRFDRRRRFSRAVQDGDGRNERPHRNHGRH
jgi:hypothetical protein